MMPMLPARLPPRPRRGIPAIHPVKFVSLPN
jgi:hypothetical protein